MRRVKAGARLFERSGRESNPRWYQHRSSQLVRLLLSAKRYRSVYPHPSQAERGVLLQGALTMIWAASAPTKNWSGSGLEVTANDHGKRGDRQLLPLT